MTEQPFAWVGLYTDYEQGDMQVSRYYLTLAFGSFPPPKRTVDGKTLRDVEGLYKRTPVTTPQGASEGALKAALHRFATGNGDFMEARRLLGDYELHPQQERAEGTPTDAMVQAGIEQQQKIQHDLDNYVSGVTPDWDEGMSVIAIWRAMNKVSLSCRADERGQPTAEKSKPCGLADPGYQDCKNMKEVGGGFGGERYHCAVCGKGYFLDYEDMK